MKIELILGLAGATLLYIRSKAIPSNIKSIVIDSDADRQSLDNYIILAKDDLLDVYAKQIGKVYNVNTALAHAIIYQESRGNAGAVGGIGERGLMQITKIALQDFNEYYNDTVLYKELFNPFINMQVGIGFIGLLIKRWGNEQDAIVAYNGGSPSNDYARTHYLPKVQQWRYYFKRKKL